MTKISLSISLMILILAVVSCSPGTGPGSKDATQEPTTPGATATPELTPTSVLAPATEESTQRTTGEAAQPVRRAASLRPGYCGRLCENSFWESFPEAGDVLAELDLGVDLSATGLRDWTPLHLAVSASTTDVVALLIDSGAPVNQLDVQGRGPLFMIGLNHRATAEMVGQLVRAGADIRARDASGWEPLNTVSRRGKPEVVQAMIDHGADPMSTIANELTPLHQAAAWNVNGPGVMAVLISSGADIEARSSHGTTPLLYAATTFPDLANLEYLLNQGADREAINNNGMNVLFVAASANPSTKVLKYLIDTGSDPVGLDDANGSTAIHVAVVQNPGGIQVIDFLLTQGADINSADAFNQTPLHYAVDAGRSPDFLEAMIERGADVSIKSTEGLSACDVASNAGLDSTTKEVVCN